MKRGVRCTETMTKHTIDIRFRGEGKAAMLLYWRDTFSRPHADEADQEHVFIFRNGMVYVLCFDGAIERHEAERIVNAWFSGDELQHVLSTSQRGKRRNFGTP